MKFEFSTFKTVASCSLMMFANYSLSAQETFKINAEIINRISNESSNVFPVIAKEVEGYLFIKGKVPTIQYREFLEKKKSLEKEYNEYMSRSKTEKESTYTPIVVDDYPQWLELEKEFTESYKYEDGYVKSETKSRRIQYMVDKNNIISNFSVIQGNYEIISNSMMIADDTIEDRFIENELSEDVRNYYKYSGKNYTVLIKNIETHNLYVIPYETFQEIQNIKDNRELGNYIESIGYKTFYDNGKLYITTKHYKVPVTSILKQLIENDKDYLKNIDLRFERMQILRKQSLTYIPKMENYVRLYRLQRNRMSKADISAWTTLTKSALAINKQFVDLNDKMWGTDYEILDKNYLKFSNEFNDYLDASMGVLGF